MLCIAVAGTLAAATVLAASPGLQRSAFVRGDASSKVKPKQQPKTEREAVAAKHVVAHGIVAMELPEDRMVNLVATTRADGSIEIGHEEADAAPAPAKEIARD